MPLDFPKFQIESDALQIVRLLNNEEMDNTELDGFIKEAQDLLTHLDIQAIIHCPRIHNGRAHFLAQRACELNVFDSWENEFPKWLTDFNASDTRCNTYICGGPYPTGGTLLGAFDSS